MSKKTKLSALALSSAQITHTMWLAELASDAGLNINSKSLSKRLKVQTSGLLTTPSSSKDGSKDVDSH